MSEYDARLGRCLLGFIGWRLFRTKAIARREIHQSRRGGFQGPGSAQYFMGAARESRGTLRKGQNGDKNKKVGNRHGMMVTNQQVDFAWRHSTDTHPSPGKIGREASRRISISILGFSIIIALLHPLCFCLESKIEIRAGSRRCVYCKIGFVASLECGVIWIDNQGFGRQAYKLA